MESDGIDIGWVLRTKEKREITGKSGDDRKTNDKEKESLENISNSEMSIDMEAHGVKRIVQQNKGLRAGAENVPNPFGYDLSGIDMKKKKKKTEDGGKEGSLRRTQSLSLPSGSQKRKSGFFRNLFRRKSVSVAGMQSDKEKRGKSEDDSREECDSLNRVKTEPCMFGVGTDTRLEEFISSCKEGVIGKTEAQRREKRQEENIVAGVDEMDCRLDRKGRRIPAHPAKSRLPSALRIQSDSLDSESEVNSPKDTMSLEIFGSLLKRARSHANDSHANGSNTQSTSSTSDSLHLKADNSSSDCVRGNSLNSIVIPGLENVKPLKRVSFASTTYFNDPPQQICSRNPRKGEVEVKDNGSVVIHRLTAEEKKHLMENSSSGIVVGGSGQLKLLNTDDRKMPKVTGDDVDDTKIEMNQTAAKNMRNLKLAAAEAAAEARAINEPLELQRTITNNEEEVSVNTSVSKVTIDKPMISRRDKSSTTSLSSMISSESMFISSDDENDILPPKNLKIPHDVVYTRCCHLREILPIPATLKQLKKGSFDPIPLLQLRNPKPSKIEVLSFSDFLSVSPVLCLSLDGVSLSVDMLRTILSSVASRKNFEKLSLRNTPLDIDGWKVLCYFVSTCKSLNSLDLTMVPDLSLNVQRPSKSSANSTVVRMVCNLNDRSDMNWSLLSAAVATRGGLEEMYLNGACMSLHQFQTFIDIAWNKTIRLGLAYNKLTREHCEALAIWFKTSKITGMDIGYNNLDGKLRPLIDAIMQKSKLGKNVMKYLSLNSTNLIVPEGATVDNNEVLSLLSTLCYCENLKFLDLSNNKDLFPHGISTLTSTLPVFVNLVRLNLDSNQIPPMDIVQLAEVLPFCKRLIHISLLGTRLNFITANALATAVKSSDSILTLDIDLENVPERIKEKISLYTMRNTQKELKHLASDDGNSASSSNKLSSIQDQISSLLTEDVSTRQDYHTVASNLLKRIQSMRAKLHMATEELFKLRVNGELSTDGKETLIRFCCIDASLEKGLGLLLRKNNHSAEKLQATPIMRSDSQISTTSNSSMIYSTEFTKNGRGALLPFHEPSIESYEPADEEVPITDETRQIQNEVTTQLREEGSVLRKTHDLVDGLRTTADKAGKELNTELLKQLTEKYNGEDIKNLLLNKDISGILSILDQLSMQGVGMDHIFRKKQDDRKQSSPHTNPDSSSPIIIGVEANLRDNQTDRYSHSDYTTDEDEDEERMDRAYDQVIDSLQHSRSKTGPVETS